MPAFEKCGRCAYRMLVSIEPEEAQQRPRRRIVIKCAPGFIGARMEDLVQVSVSAISRPVWVENLESVYYAFCDANDDLWMRFVRNALSEGELVGKSEFDAVWGLFWHHFILDDEGMAYLTRWAPHSRNSLLLQRISGLTTESEAVLAIWRAQNFSLKDNGNATAEIDRLYAMCRRALEDSDFGDAICSLVATGNDVDDRVRAFLSQHA